VVDLDGREVFTSASIGIAVVSSERAYESAQDMLRDADTAMYRAKAMGKANHEVFDAEMRAQVVQLLRLETDLRRAVEHEDFEPHFQPIVDLASGAVVGFETLARWPDPVRGLVAPGEFIPLAEETGLIVDIDRLMLRASCVQLAEWRARFPELGPLTVSTNLSGVSFRRNDAVSHLQALLAERRLPSDAVHIELTETEIMEDTEAAMAVLSDLRALGVQLVMDDFGTGYSSFSYLHRLPLQVLKIDRAFVSRLGVSRSDFDIVKTMVVLAHNLGIRVVAEGVETAEQLALLREMGCDRAQGFFIAQPLTAAAATGLLASKRRW
jgi:EAL domain-containing protein (putative c-di-GMP-specific phosphodiesterase class I)